MAYSRTSVPLFASILLAIAAYILYLVLTKNIFNLYVFNDESVNQSKGRAVTNEVDLPIAADSGDQSLASSASLVKRILAPNNQSAVLQEQTDKNLSSFEKTQAAHTSQQKEKDQLLVAAGPGIQLVESLQSPQTLYNYELKLLWDKYSAKIPRLYSRRANAETQTILGRVGEISMGLDLLYLHDSEAWMQRLGQIRSELISIATQGEREAARALSFQYFRSPLGNAIDSLSWAMIANAMAPNDYYLTICASNSAACSEAAFAQASEQAKNDVLNYGFVVKR